MNEDGMWETTREQGERESREKEKISQIINVVANLSLLKDGRQFLRALADASDTFKPNYNTDISVSAFREGKRAVGLLLLDWCVRAGCPDVLFDGGEEDE